MTLTYNLQNLFVICDDGKIHIQGFSCSPLGVPLSPFQIIWHTSVASSLALDHIGCLPSTDVNGVSDLTITLTIASDPCLQMGQSNLVKGWKEMWKGLCLNAFCYLPAFLEPPSCLVDIIIAVFPSSPGRPPTFFHQVVIPHMPLIGSRKDLSVSASFLLLWFHLSLTCTQLSNLFL